VPFRKEANGQVNFFNRARLIACAVTVFAALAAPRIASADIGHLPIIDIRPVATFDNTGSTTLSGAATNNGTLNGSNGDVVINGTVTLPLFKGVSFSYDRNEGELIYATLVLPGAPKAGVPFKDMIQDYRLDWVANRYLTVEASLANRHRECCPGSSDPNIPAAEGSTEWHTGNLGLTFTSPSFDILNHGVIVLNITGHTANHNQTAAVAAAEGSQSIGNVREYGTSQAATLVYPIDIRHRLTATATYTWGALDYFENAPFPWSYKIWIFGLNKTVNPWFNFSLTAANLTQGEQGSPFPVPNTIHEATYWLTGDFHLDFNKIFAAPPPAK
jgi:hypothetical protein